MPLPHDLPKAAPGAGICVYAPDADNPRQWIISIYHPDQSVEHRGGFRSEDAAFVACRLCQLEQNHMARESK